jgi:hypothetical protein
MIVVPRQRALSLKVNEVLCPSNLLQNPFLVSRVLPLNRIPVASLLCLPSILKLRPTQFELIQCCIASSHVDVIQDFGFISICPRIAICPSTLIISSAAQSGTIFEVHDFVRLLTGNVRFSIYQISDCADYAACFEAIDDCIAAWRAINFVPFRGRLLEVRAYGTEPVQPAKDIIVVKPRPSPLNFVPRRKEKEV